MEIFQARREQAESQALALGLAGPEERFQSKAYFEQLRQTGIGNASPQVIAGARALHPQAVDEMAMAAGERIQKGYRVGAEKEYQYTVSETRTQEDQARQDIANSGTEMSKSMATAVAAVMAEFTQKMAAGFQEQLNLEFSKQWNQKKLAANGQGN